MSLPKPIPKVEAVEPVLRLVWVDHTFHDAPAGATIDNYERTREFLHLGGAIAWARRRIFRGEVYADVVELQKVHRVKMDGVLQDDIEEAKDITLAGFQSWEDPTGWGRSTGVRLSKVHKRCVWED